MKATKKIIKIIANLYRAKNDAVQITNNTFYWGKNTVNDRLSNQNSIKRSVRVCSQS